MKATYKITEIRGSTVIIVVNLEDNRGFTIYAGADRLGEIEYLIREHAKALFNIEVTLIEKTE